MASVALLLWPIATRLGAAPSPVVPDSVPDRWEAAAPEHQRIHGALAARLKLHAKGLTALLDRTGAGLSGLWLEAAALIWPYQQDPRLTAAMQRAAAALAGEASAAAGAQDLDVSRRTLSGLLAFYLAVGDQGALGAARRMGDLLSRSPLLGGAADPGAALLLEPACVLFRYTGERRQLTQAVTRSSGQPGAALPWLRVLLETDSVYRASRARAELILASLSGLLELHRLSGESAYRKLGQSAWEDIRANRLYVTGAVSSAGYFKDDGALPGEAAARVGEAGAIAEWLRLNWHLLRLTGETRYADQIERTLYNHLLAAQHAAGGGIARDVPLVGRKRFDGEPGDAWASHALAMGLALRATWGMLEGSPAVALYVPGESRLAVRLRGEHLQVVLRSETRLPEEGSALLTVYPSRPAGFPVYLRVPSWCERFSAVVEGVRFEGQAGQWLRLERSWQPGDRILVRMEMPVRLLPGGGAYENHVAIQRGPQVLALERALNPELPHLHRAAPASIVDLRLVAVPGRIPRGWIGTQVYGLEGIASGGHGGRQSVAKTRLFLVPFADAAEYRVWLPRPDRLPVGPVAVTAFGEESWSDAGDADGSICDERADTYRTVRRKGAGEHWYAVEMGRPARIQQVVYRHGKRLPDGGWFDTSGGKPRIEIKRARHGPWEAVATLDSYPEATAERAPDLYDGQPFEVRLPAPIEVVAVRIVGRPAHSATTCAELAAYAPSAGAVESRANTLNAGPIRTAKIKP